MDAISGAGTTNPSGTSEFRVYERGVQSVHLSRTRRARRGPWISEELHSLNYRRFVLDFFFFVVGIFKYF
jgi:hypothetical protein